LVCPSIPHSNRSARIHPRLLPVDPHDISYSSSLSSLPPSPPASPSPTAVSSCHSHSPSTVSAPHHRSSSSSSNEYHTVCLKPYMSSTTTPTAVLSLNNGKRPMISTGAMSPELLHRFEHHARGYLQSKDGLDAKNYVNHIVYSFEDLLFSDWYQSQQELLSILSFTDFMARVHACWLPKRWQQPVQLLLYMKLGDLPNKAHASSWLTAQIGSCPRLSDIYYHKM
jgi:hypothetical protein